MPIEGYQFIPHGNTEAKPLEKCEVCRGAGEVPK